MTAFRRALHASLVLLGTGPLAAQEFAGSCFLGTVGDLIALDAGPGGELYFATGSSSTPARAGTVTSGCSVTSQFSIATETGGARGITTANGQIFVTDSFVSEVDVYDTSGAYVTSWPVPMAWPRGIAYSAATDRLYIADDSSPRRVLELTRTGTLTNTWPLNGWFLGGIAWDPADDSFWVYDFGTDSLRHYSAAFQELASVRGPAFHGLGAGHGVAVSGNDIFVTAGLDRIVRYIKSGSLATSARFGSSCPAPTTIYETFALGTVDLAGKSVELIPNGADYIARLCPTSCFDPGFAALQPMLDDEVVTRNVPFQWQIQGIPPNAPIRIDSNGRVGWSFNSSIYLESVHELLTGRIIAPCWDDLNPAAGGGVYYDVDFNRVLITWDQVPQFGGSGANTFQVRIEPQGRIVISWQQIGADALIGFNLRPTGTDPGAIDISGLQPTYLNRNAVELSSNVPIIGTTLQLQTAGVSSNVVFGATAIGSPQSAIPIPGTLPGCRAYCSVWATLPMNLASGLSGLALPNDPLMLGLPLRAQSAMLDPTISSVLPIVVSNGLDLVVGDV